MKKLHLISLIIIAVALTVIIVTVGDASTYVTFQEAKDMQVTGNTKKVHVVGRLQHNKTGEVSGIKIHASKLMFSFVMVDKNDMEQIVDYHAPMPADFTRSEQLVIVGAYTTDDRFVADKILLKCPSKYQSTKMEVR